MIKNYLKTAWRNIFGNRTFSLINIIGLSVSMSLGLLVILILKEQYSFDNFHKDAGRIYRVNTKAIRTEGGMESYASTPIAVGTALKQGYSFTEDVVRINSQLNGDAIYGNVNVPVRGFFADHSFLDVFNFQLQEGNPATALTSPDDILLTPATAKKIFGNAEPIGKTLTIKGYGNFTVKGIFKTPPSKTHLEFELMASVLALESLEKQKAVMPSLQDWTNYYTGNVYIKLKDGISQKEVKTALAEIYRKNVSGLKLETRDKGYEYYLQPLTEITPGPMLSNNRGRALPAIILKFLSILAFIIMLMAGLNYTNLVIAKSLKRSREIGVRKVMGAQRREVFWQFITESVVFALISLVFAYLILLFLKPAFLKLRITNEFSIDLKEDYWIYGYFIFFAVAIGFIAGLLPAGYLSSFKPITVLKNTVGNKVNKRFSLRKALMVLQFTLSVVFISIVLVLSSQVKFLMRSDLGVNDKDLLNIRLQGNDFKKLSQEIQSIPGVKNIGAVSHSLGTSQDRSDDYKKDATDAPFVMRDFRVDANYISNLKMQFVAGHNFHENISAERETEVILNESALMLFGFKDAGSAIGQQIFSEDSVALSVSGVVKDFHFRPMMDAIGPLALRYKPADFSIMNIAIEPGSTDKVIAAISPIWKKTDPVHALEIKLMSQEIDDAYIESGLVDILHVIEYVTILSVIIACLGMLGMVMYSTRLRLKEISVRKVMGADIKSITILLSRSFMKLVVIGLLIGIPLSYLLGNIILQNFAYKITTLPLLIIAAVLIIALLGLITICSQTIKAALIIPVKSLRTE
ncbi:MAG: ABC transporter permease [Ferruginibacter sp.]